MNSHPLERQLTVLCPACGKQRAGLHNCDGIELDVGGLTVLAHLADAFMAEGVRQGRAGRYDDARRAFEAALVQDATNVDARLGLARVYAREGRVGEARALLLRLREEAPGDNRIARTLAALPEGETERGTPVWRRGVAWPLIVVLVLGCVAVAAAVTAFVVRDDKDDGAAPVVAVAEAGSRAIAESGPLNGADIAVAGDATRLSLSGEVATDTQRDIAIAIASQYADAVDASSLTILPVSDTAVAARAALAVCGRRAPRRGRVAPARSCDLTARNDGALTIVGKVPSETERRAVVSVLRAAAGSQPLDTSELTVDVPSAVYYTVVAGDTLSSIAARELGDGTRWREIYSLNRAIIADSNLLYAGDVLLLPPPELSP